MKASDLKGRAVITMQSPTKVGSVKDLIFDPNQKRVAGLKISPGAFSEDKYVRAEDIRSIGPDAVTITDPAVLGTADSFTALAQLPDLGDLTSSHVVSQSGEKAGSISDVLIDPSQLAITGYVLGGGFLSQFTHDEKVLDATKEMRYGRGILMIPDAEAARLTGREVPSTTVEHHETAAPRPQRRVGEPIDGEQVPPAEEHSHEETPPPADQGPYAP